MTHYSRMPQTLPIMIMKKTKNICLTEGCPGYQFEKAKYMTLLQEKTGKSVFSLIDLDPITRRPVQ